MNKRIQSAIAAATSKVTGKAEEEAPENEDVTTAEEQEDDQPDAEGEDQPEEEPDAEGDEPDDEGEEDEPKPDASVSKERSRCSAIVKAGISANQMALASVLIDEGTSATQAKTILGSVTASNAGKSKLADRHAGSQGNQRPGRDGGAGSVKADLASVAAKQFPKRVTK